MRPTARALALPLLCASMALSANPYPAGNPGPYFQPAPSAGYRPAPFASPAAPAFQRRSAEQAPAWIVREGLGKLDAFLRSGEAGDPAVVETYLAREIAPYFDLAYMSRWAAGPLYHRLSPEQRVTLAKGIGELFFRNMATHLAGYQGGEIHYLPGADPRSGETTVRVQVGGTDRPPIRIDFRMYRSDDGWKVFDVQANGRSAVVHYRNLLANLTRQAGVQGMLERIASL
ncbi:MlaC/ttg2D family ABC transporter substrate-binding protein [Endothiovibrio diazotrophicus]